MKKVCPTRSRVRSTFVAGVALAGVLVTANAASAGTITFGTNVSSPSMKVTYTAAGSVGKLTFVGETFSYKPKGGSTTYFDGMSFGTYDATVNFNLATGAMLGTGSELTLTGLIGGINRTLYHSTQVYFLTSNLTGTTGNTFDMLWRKDDGYFFDSADVPFIKTMITINSVITKGLSPFGAAFGTAGKTGTFTNALPTYSLADAGAGGVIFQNDGQGSANTFLVPSPAALPGGVAAIAFGVWHRRRRAASIVVKNV